MEKIALLPGGFKPPHAGHYNMAKWLAANTDADSVVIKVGSKERDGITRDISLQLWDLYRKADKNSNKLVIVPSESPSPVRDVYDFIEQEAPEKSTVYLGMGEKDIEDQRFKNIGKFAEPKGINFKTVLVPPQAGGISGTAMREFINNGDKDSFQKYLPDHLNSEQKDEAWNIVSSLEEDFYDPRNKTVDFMRSSEYKAGMPDGPKDDIPRKGDHLGMRQRNPHAHMAESLKEQQGGKTLRVYDFDDTLAVTKGANIKIKHADGSMDTLDPAEFAVYDAQEGDKFDFTEFDRVIKDAEPIQNIISMLRKDLETTAKVTILTARLIAYPVRRYLKSLDLDAYVVAVGSSDPMDKANWIKNHIEKGYNDILFIDDSEKNRNAVLSLKDEYPDIKLDVQDPNNIKEMFSGPAMNKQEMNKHKANMKKLKKVLNKTNSQTDMVKVPRNLTRGLRLKLYEDKYYVDNSNIQGIGAFADDNYPAGTIMGKLHDMPTEINPEYNFYKLGKSYNHSDTPNCENLLHNNIRYLVTIQPIQKGEELTADYRLQPDLEQPEHFEENIDPKAQAKHKGKAAPYGSAYEPVNEADPKKGTGKKPKGSSRRLYTDENPKDTVKVKFSTRQDIVDTLTKKSFKNKPHKRQSQIINLIHQRVRAALSRTKDPQKKKSLKSAFEYIKKRKETSKKKTQRMKKENVFTKEWWKDTLNEILLKEGGAAGHMAHPFNLDSIKTGKDLKDIFEKSAESLQTNPGAVKIDGVNSSIRLVDIDGTKQFVMDRGSKKELDVRGITKADLEDRFGEGHGMIKVGGAVLDMFNEALPDLESDLKKLGAWDNPNILFNMEFVSGKTNVQQYESNFIAIHGLMEIKNKEVEGKRGPLIKRVASEISYNDSDLQSLLNNLEPIAKEKGFKVYGSVPTEMDKTPDFNSALSKTYEIVSNEGKESKSLDQWLDNISAIPEKDFIFMNVNNSQKKVGAVSKQVYIALLQGENVDELFEDEEDKKKAIDGFVTYLATEKLGDEILKVLNSPMGSVEDHEGVVIRDKNISNEPFKITGKFILGGLETSFR